MGEIYSFDPYTSTRTRISDGLASEVLAFIRGVSEGAEELISRLGEGAKVVRGNLVYEGYVIGKLDNEEQVSLSIGEENVVVSIDDLEVIEGELTMVNRERTEEMGLEWREQIWVEGERIAVPWVFPIFARKYTVENHVVEYKFVWVPGTNF